MKKRVAFVINPNSGSDRKTDRVALVKKMISDAYESEIFPWMKVEERDEIFERVINGNFDVAVAVGGDGTVSQLAEALCGKNTALGIVPFGSGNGLARHLGVPVNPEEAMKLLETGVVKKIDRGHFNNRSFVCTAGVGFDARIGKLFAESTERGFWTYARMTIGELKNYVPEKYSITLDGNKNISCTAFLVTVANAGQYGNNAWIAPKASVCDGMLHLSILKPFRWWNVPGIAMKMFRKKIDTSAFVESHCAKTISIQRENSGPTHYDGEPDTMGTTLNATIDPGVLNVIVPTGKKI